jgi:hypothetical protein
MSGSSLAVVEPKLDDANTPASTPVPFHDDPDLAELEAARAAVAAEQASSGTSPPPTAPAPAGGEAPAAPAAAGGEPPPVPYARFAEVLARMTRAEQAAAYHEGRANALTAPGGAPAPTDTPASTPAAEPPEYAEARAIEQEWNEAWGEYDTGAITAADLGQRQVGLMARVVKLNMDRVVRDMQAWTQQAIRNLPPAVGVVDQQVMDEHVARLEAAHPWSAALSEKEASTLIRMAQAEAEMLGRAYPKGPTGTMALQQRVAELASIHMPQWHPGQEPPAVNRRPGTAPAAINPQPAAPAAVPSRQAPNGPTREDIEAAMRRSAALPPNTPGAHGANSGPITLDRINTMSDEELVEMSPQERRRLLGIVQS